MKLVESKYKSAETGREIFGKEDIKNQDLIDLANSNLISGNIVNYSSDSFMFETDKLMLPRFIDKDFALGTSVIGLPLSISKLSKTEKASLLPALQKSLYHPSKVEFIKNTFNINNQIQRLQQNGRDNIADILRHFFDDNLLKKFEIDITLASDNDQNIYFIIKSKPRIDLEQIFSNYIDAIVYQNTLYRSKVGSEKLCFCPLETVLGEEISSIITLFNVISKEVRSLVGIELINVIEELKGITLDEYVNEEIKNTGIDVKNNTVSYFKNISYPNGMAVLLTDTQTGEPALCYLKKIQKYMPLELDINSYIGLFENVVYLNVHSKL